MWVYMAGFDPGTVSRCVQQLQLPALTLQHQNPDSGDDTNDHNNDIGSSGFAYGGSHVGSSTGGGCPNGERRDEPGQGLVLLAAGGLPGQVPARRKRGRPLGSKNKPKTPVIVNRESANTLRFHIVVVGGGCDVFDCMAKYTRCRQRGLCVLGGSGAVAKVGLRQPPAAAGQAAFVAVHPGRYEIGSLTGSFLPGESSSLSVLLIGSQGKIVGGRVVGPLVAVGPVVVTVAWFASVPYEQLPLDEKAAVMQMPPPATAPGSVGGGEDTHAGSGSLANPWTSGLSFFNLPLNGADCQLPVDGHGWPASAGAGCPPF